MKKVTFVIPVYNEEKSIEKLFSELLKVKEKIAYKTEFFFINDGSTDKSLNLLTEFSQKHTYCKIINFSKNFGHQIALTAGLDMCDGDAVITIDGDLQDPPEVALELIKKWEEGFEVIYAKRRTRNDRFFKRTTAFCFYRILKSIANIHIPEDIGDFRLMDKKVVNALKKFREKNRFIRGLVSLTGFQQTSVLFDRQKRFAGETKYPLKKMIKLALDGITGFSTFPLKLISYFGFFVAFLSFIGICYVLYIRLYVPQEAVPGWAFTTIPIFFIGSVQMIMLGILGEYIGRIYIETQNRPLYIVQDLINFESDL